MLKGPAWLAREMIMSEGGGYLTSLGKDSRLVGPGLISKASNCFDFPPKPTVDPIK